MKKSLSFAAVALIACASQQRTPSASTVSAADAEDRATVVQPSSLAPEQIRLLQRSLIDRGFAVDLNGTFDQPTQTALAQFQRARGLPATGNLNAPTIDALGLDPRDVDPKRSYAGRGREPAAESGTGQGSSPGYGSGQGSGTTPGAERETPPRAPASPASPDAPRPGY